MYIYFRKLCTVSNSCQGCDKKLHYFLLSIDSTSTHGDPALYMWSKNKTICVLPEYMNDSVLYSSFPTIFKRFVSKFMALLETRAVLNSEKFSQTKGEEFGKNLKLHHKALSSRLL